MWGEASADDVMSCDKRMVSRRHFAVVKKYSSISRNERNFFWLSFEGENSQKHRSVVAERNLSTSRKKGGWRDDTESRDGVQLPRRRRIE
jgi:hypothetical protein